MRRRRYRLRESALEVFLRRGKRRSLFVDFGSESRDQGRRNDFIRALETRVGGLLWWRSVAWRGTGVIGRPIGRIIGRTLDRISIGLCAAAAAKTYHADNT